MTIPERARELRKLIENAAASLTDQQASTGPEIRERRGGALSKYAKILEKGGKEKWK